MKSYVLAFSHSWPCCKIGQGQPMVIIWTMLVLLQYPILHIKFQGDRSTVSRKEILKFLPWTSMVDMLVMCPGLFFPAQGNSTWNIVTTGPMAFEEMFEIVIV